MTGRFWVWICIALLAIGQALLAMGGIVMVLQPDNNNALSFAYTDTINVERLWAGATDNKWPNCADVPAPTGTEYPDYEMNVGWVPCHLK